MRRSARAVTVVLAAAVAVALAACGGSHPGAAASVNGEDIPTRILAGITTSITDPDPDPSEYGAIDTTQRETLMQLIRSLIVEHAAEAIGVRVPKKRVDREMERIATQYGGLEGLEAEIAGRGRTIEDVRDQLAATVRQELLQQHFSDEAEVTDAEIEAEYQARLDREYRFVQMSLILVRGRAEAERLVAQIGGGADFAQLAEEHSLDQTTAATGGETERNRGALPEEIDDEVWAAEPGTLIGPRRVELGTDDSGAPLHGFLVIRVNGFRTITLEDVRDDLRDQIAGRAANVSLEEFVTDAFTSAEVWVDPRIGRWDSDTATVLPPEGAAPPAQPSPQPTPVPTGPPPPMTPTPSPERG